MEVVKRLCELCICDGARKRRKKKFRCVFAAHDERPCAVVAGELRCMTSHITRTASFETARRKRTQTYEWRQEVDRDDTCDIAIQMKSVSGVFASYTEIHLHVLRMTRLESVSYCEVYAKQRKEGKAHRMRDDQSLLVCLACISRMYESESAAGVCSNVTWNGMYE